LAQDDYFYEIQLTNKQLVFYFMAGATGLILSFLAGVMVGRGVDAGGEVQASRPVREATVITEETPRPIPPAPGELSYAGRLEADKVDATLERPAPSAEPERPKTEARATPPPRAATPAPRSTPRPVKATPAPAKPEPSASAAPTETRAASSARPEAAGSAGDAAAPASGGKFTIQVGAFKDRSGADAVLGQLKAKGYAAYVEPGSAGLYNVRVGTYGDRADAERTLGKLRDDEKLKPFIVKN
jgi:cell division protein FtsN